MLITVAEEAYERQIDLTVSEAKVLLTVIHMLDVIGYHVMAKGVDDDWELWTELGIEELGGIADYTDHQLWIIEPQGECWNSNGRSHKSRYPEPNPPTTHIT